MTAGSIYVGATGDTGGPVFGWGGNGWLYSALPKGDPAYEWIWGESWSPDFGHDASNTILTADCRTKYGNRGPWLFGEFSIADAMYAPVVLRFNHYGATGLTAHSQAYVRHWLQDAQMREWIAGAEGEL